jgi:hypothetical protein
MKNELEALDLATLEMNVGVAQAVSDVLDGIKTPKELMHHVTVSYEHLISRVQIQDLGEVVMVKLVAYALQNQCQVLGMIEDLDREIKNLNAEIERRSNASA